MSDQGDPSQYPFLQALLGTQPGAGIPAQLFLNALLEIARAIRAQTSIIATIMTTTSVALPVGTSGILLINNGTAAPITITLPTSPTLNQSIAAKDSAGNAATDNITFNTADASLIDGAATYVFVNNFQAATFRWNGTGWSVF